MLRGHNLSSSSGPSNLPEAELRIVGNSQVPRFNRFIQLHLGTIRIGMNPLEKKKEKEKNLGATPDVKDFPPSSKSSAEVAQMDHRLSA